MSFFKQLAQGFTGSGAKKYLNQGISAVQGKESSAIGAIQSGANEAKGYLTPWADRGGRRMYDATLGLSGTDARDAAQDTYLSDPILQKQLALQQKQRGWHSNARGGYGSGADALAASRVNLQGYGDWQNRLAGVAGQEFDATRGLADITSGAGRDTASTYMSGANALAGLYGEQAKNASTLGTNLANMLASGVQAYSAYKGAPTKGNKIG